MSFYTSSCVVSPSKMSTISPVNIIQDSPPKRVSPLDLNIDYLLINLVQYDILSGYLFEGDLPEIKNSKSNILASSESMVIESLALMRE